LSLPGPACLESVLALTHNRCVRYCRLGVILLAGSAFLHSQALADDAVNVATGRQLAFEIAKGNCLACHQFPGDSGANTLANIGPPLVAIRARFPERAQLRSRLWDPTRTTPNTVMPPYGKHGILSSDEIELIIDYLYTQ
jgi:sulfur-oxidizing protein SoxX